MAWNASALSYISAQVSRFLCKNSGFGKLTFADQQSKVTILFAPNAEQVVIERHNVWTDKSDVYMDINDNREVAPHTLFSTRERDGNIITQESLDIHLFLDASVLEVFINERVAISTRIYAESGRCFGVRPFAQYTPGFTDGEKARVLECVGWELQPSVRWM